MQISFNGQLLQTDCQLLSQLLEAQNLHLKTSLACAVNQHFVPRSQWPTYTLQAGDKIDVVAPVAGG
jgi:sulfur carrier protein